MIASPAYGDEIALSPEKQAFFDTYEQLVETNTTHSEGDCTLAAQRMADRLTAAGVPEADLHLFSVADHPKEGGLVAVWQGRDRKAGAMLLLAHIDVVEADPNDWERDPFTLIGEDGFYYARGAVDDKAMAAIWVDTIARFARAGYHPKRTVKVALTCGEETNGAFNGAEWLAANRRDLIDAAFALNEGGGGTYKEDGAYGPVNLQVGEKIFANYELTVTNEGGHSAAPRPDNAIYELADALKKVEAHRFPVEFNDVTRRSFLAQGRAIGGDLGKAMIALANDPSDMAADAVVSQEPGLRSNSRTTCVATTVEAGHARNALPQKAVANVNCRIFPGHTVTEIGALIQGLLGNGVAVTTLEPVRPAPPAPPLNPEIIQPIKEALERHFPGAELGVGMSNGYTDSTFLTAVGIPAYGVPGLFGEPDGNGAHGLNERIRARSLWEGRDFLYDLVKRLAN